MKGFLLRWLVNFFGLWTAATLLAGISYQENLRVLIWASLIFSLVNMLIKPVVILLTLPAIVLTLGLFTFVVNALMLYVVTFFYHSFRVTSFGQALLAVVIIWIVNYLLNDVIEPKEAM